ncbi:hypothetical protein HZB96_05480 [Candidatus Gottesmanbacteria bacterium]|nr:hypothetical protein [Candidatus Gottesmanbacteria bacterium]MBI5452769.1 hypothetical protein [Candidatus Gottesmanbacteria bacterium]
MREAKASCPASISLIFKACPDKNPYKTGSTGVGFTVDKKVSVRVKPSVKNRVLFNGKEISFPTVFAVLEKFKKTAEVNITSSLPLGFGFGISGASALATSFAINKLFALNKSPLELTGIAHVAEIENKTGLGSVGTVASGGFLVKTAPGIPVVARKLPFAGKKVYATIIKRLPTKSVLKNKKRLAIINQSARVQLEKIKKIASPSLEEIIDNAYNFALESGLVDNREVVNLIESIRKNGGHATMAMLGHVVISDTKPDFAKNYRIEEFVITNSHIETTA